MCSCGVDVPVAVRIARVMIEEEPEVDPEGPAERVALEAV